MSWVPADELRRAARHADRETAEMLERLAREPDRSPRRDYAKPPPAPSPKRMRQLPLFESPNRKE